MVSLYKIVNEYGLRLAFCLGKVQVKSPFLEIIACADDDFFPWEIVVISCVGSTTFPRCGRSFDYQRFSTLENHVLQIVGGEFHGDAGRIIVVGLRGVVVTGDII